MNKNELVQVLEAILLCAKEPYSLNRLQAILTESEEEQFPAELLLEALVQIQSDCMHRGYELVEVFSGYRFQVKQAMAHWVGKIKEEKPQRYSRALLETLALVAYRQPITRGEIEGIRGVAVSTHIIKTLLEHEWIRVIGHKECPGRPALYSTTRQFLDHFNLKSLDELPPLSEITELAKMPEQIELAIEDLEDESDQEEALDLEEIDVFEEENVESVG